MSICRLGWAAEARRFSSSSDSNCCLEISVVPFLASGNVGEARRFNNDSNSHSNYGGARTRFDESLVESRSVEITHGIYEEELIEKRQSVCGGERCVG